MEPDDPPDLTLPPTLDSHSLTTDTPEPPPDDPTPHISFNALSGLTAPTTFHLFGSLNHARVTVLIDSGSTHSFIQPRVAKFLSLTPLDTSLL